MKILTVDTEATIFQKGNPYANRNKLCCVGVYDGTTYHCYPIEYDSEPYGEHLQELRRLLEEAELLIGFNIKYDLHWLHRYLPGLHISNVWDCQLGAFILSAQLTPYPSLDGVASGYGLDRKPSIVARIS